MIVEHQLLVVTITYGHYATVDMLLSQDKGDLAEQRKWRFAVQVQH